METLKEEDGGGGVSKVQLIDVVMSSSCVQLEEQLSTEKNVLVSLKKPVPESVVIIVVRSSRKRQWHKCWSVRLKSA